MSNGPAIPDRSVILAAAAEDMDLKGKIALMSKQRNLNRNGYRGRGIKLAKLDAFVKTKDFTFPELMEDIAEDIAYKTAANPRAAAKFEQLDLFSPTKDVSMEVQRSAWRHKGLMWGLEGKDMQMPPSAAGFEYEAAEEGWREGQDILMNKSDLLKVGDAPPAAPKKPGRKPKADAAPKAAPDKRPGDPLDDPNSPESLKAAAEAGGAKPPEDGAGGDEEFEMSEEELAAQTARAKGALDKMTDAESPKPKAPRAVRVPLNPTQAARMKTSRQKAN